MEKDGQHYIVLPTISMAQVLQNNTVVTSHTPTDDTQTVNVK